MRPQEIRKRILEVLYEKRSSNFVNPDELAKIVGVSDEIIDTEIRYLDEKYLLKITGKYMGREFLNFLGVKITSQGVDLIEDPEKFNKLFTIKINNNSFGNVSNSNVNIDSKKMKQGIFNSPTHKRWHENWWGKIIIGVIIAVVSGAIVYYFGWQQ